MRCEDCKDAPQACFKKECLPQFQEDRLRMWRANDGTKYSMALGRQMPDSRQELRRIEKEKGIEMISPREAASDHHRAMMEYSQAQRQGANHDEAQTVAPWPQVSTKGKFAKKVMDWANNGGMREKISLGG